MKKKTRKSRPVRREINSGDKTIDNLYNAVIDYVDKRRGSAVVIGGVSLVDEGNGKYNYGIMVRVTGKRPEFQTEFQAPAAFERKEKELTPQPRCMTLRND